MPDFYHTVIQQSQTKEKIFSNPFLIKPLLVLNYLGIVKWLIDKTYITEDTP